MQLFHYVQNGGIRIKSSLFTALSLLALMLSIGQPLQALPFTTLPPTQHHHPRILNENTGINYNDLQTAIDDASPGDTLKISGKCYGGFFIDKNLTLVGGDDAVLDGYQTVRVLDIGSVVLSQVVTLKNLTIQNGLATDGAGISNQGDLTVINCTVQYNIATSGAGGGIESFNTDRLPTTGCLTLINSEVRHNSSATFGGGISNTAGMLNIQNSKIKYNTCTGTGITSPGGGGIFTTLETSDTITNTEIKGNLVSNGGGGGLAAAASVVILNNVNFKYNVAVLGGAVFNAVGSLSFLQAWMHKNKAVGNGGGVFNAEGGTVILTKSKIDKNIAVTGTGGGIFYFQGTTLELDKTSVEDNEPNDIVELPNPD